MEERKGRGIKMRLGYLVLLIAAGYLTAGIQEGWGETRAEGSVIQESLYDYPLTYREKPLGYREFPAGWRERPLGFSEKSRGYRERPLGFREKLPGYLEFPRHFSETPPNFIERENHLLANPDEDLRQPPKNSDETLIPDRFSTEPAHYRVDKD